MTIKIKCHDCHHQNRQWMGTPGYEFKEYEFNTFSDAHRHMMQNPDHWMDFEIYDGEEDD